MIAHRRALVIIALLLGTLAFFLVEGGAHSTSAMPGVRFGQGATPTNTPTPPGTNTVTRTPHTLTPSATPVCNPWTEVAPYPTADFSLMATSLNDDVYAFGGRDANYVRLASAYRYHPASNGWTALANMPQICFWCSAVDANGHIYIINGSHDQGPANDSSIYDPVTNTWNPGPMGLVGTYGQAALYLNGVLYRIGGIENGGYSTSVEDYGHTFLAPLPQPAAWEQAIALGGYIYVAGGSTNGGLTNKTYRYDPASNTWDDAAIADLPEPRGWAASGAVNGKWTIVGGLGTEDSAIQWDEATNSWSHIAPPIFPRSDMGGAVVGPAGSQALYLVAGLSNVVMTGSPDNEVTANVQQYRPGSCAPTCSPTTTATSTATVTVTTIASSTPATCAIQFSDVPSGSTFYPYIRCLACRGIVSGYADGTFQPSNNVTRGQLSKIVSNSAGFSDPQPNQMFEDVAVGSTFQVYIGRLASRGYIGGYPCGGPGEPCGPGNLPYFRPNANATRGQITKIDANAAGYSDTPTGQQFEDVTVGSTYYTYTYRLVSRGSMGGYPCSGPGEPCVPPGNLPYFRPNNNATRGQTAKIVANTFFPNCNTPARP